MNYQKLYQGQPALTKLEGVPEGPERKNHVGGHLKRVKGFNQSGRSGFRPLRRGHAKNPCERGIRRANQLRRALEGWSGDRGRQKEVSRSHYEKQRRRQRNPSQHRSPKGLDRERHQQRAVETYRIQIRVLPTHQREAGQLVREHAKRVCRKISQCPQPFHPSHRATVQSQQRKQCRRPIERETTRSGNRDRTVCKMVVSYSTSGHQRKVFTTPLLIEANKRRNTKQFTKGLTRCQRGGVCGAANQNASPKQTNVVNQTTRQRRSRGFA